MTTYALLGSSVLLLAIVLGLLLWKKPAIKSALRTRRMGLALLKGNWLILRRGSFKRMPREQLQRNMEVHVRKVLIIKLGRKLSKRRTPFRFCGLDPASHAKLQEEEDKLQAEYPDEFPYLITPIDELLRKFTNEGIKVVLGKDPDSGNVYVLPWNSNNIEKESVFPADLLNSASLNFNSGLRELILRDREVRANKASAKK